MVSLIPRKHSLAVSGTPARTDIRDLMGSLKFLRVPVIPSDGRLWHRLQQAPMRSAFEGVFQSLAIRTTKKEVSFSEFDCLPKLTLRFRLSASSACPVKPGSSFPSSSRPSRCTITTIPSIDSGNSCTYL